MSDETNKPRFDWVGDVIIPLLMPYALTGVVLLAFSFSTQTAAPAPTMSQAPDELCRAYFAWKEQAHDTSPGMEKECSKP